MKRQGGGALPFPLQGLPDLGDELAVLPPQELEVGQDPVGEDLLPGFQDPDLLDVELLGDLVGEAL